MQEEEKQFYEEWELKILEIMEEENKEKISS